VYKFKRHKNFLNHIFIYHDRQVEHFVKPHHVGRKTMNKQNKLLTGSLIGISLLIQGSIVSANQTSEYLSSISLDVEQGINSHMVVLHNVSGSNDANSVNIQPQQNELTFNLDGEVECIDDNDIFYDNSKAYFGPVSLFVDMIIDNQALFDAPYSPTFAYGKGKFEIHEAGNFDPFVVPLAQIKQGHPAIRFDPIEELNKKLQQHLNQGGTKLDFYQNDHLINVQRTISMASWCRLEGSNTKKAGFAAKVVELTVKYEGDPNLTKESPKLNAQLGNNVPNQFGNQFETDLANVTFQPNMPHHYGECLPDEDPQIQLNLAFANKQNSQGAGTINVRVVPDNNAYDFVGNYFYRSTQVDPKTDNALTMTFPLTAILSQQQNAQMAVSDNKVWNHNMKIQARFKPYGEVFGEWKDYDTATFKHRCEPQVQFNSPAGVGGYQQNGNNAPINPDGIQVKPMPVEPKPVVPTPSRLKPVEVAPQLDKIQQQAIPTDPSTVVPTPSRLKPVEVKPTLDKIQPAVPVEPKPVVPTESDLRARD
jgi:hypothetical protein